MKGVVIGWMVEFRYKDKKSNSIFIPGTMNLPYFYKDEDYSRYSCRRTKFTHGIK